MEQALLGNLAVVALFISGWVHAQHWLEARRRLDAASVNMGDGVLIDFRTSLVALASFVGGPIAALISATMAVAFRVATGCSGVFGGAIGTLAASATGLVGYYLSSRGRPTCLQALLLAVAAAAIPLIGALAVPSTLVAEAMLRLGIASSRLARRGDVWRQLSDPARYANGRNAGRRPVRREFHS